MKDMEEEEVEVHKRLRLTMRTKIVLLATPFILCTIFLSMIAGPLLMDMIVSVASEDEGPGNVSRLKSDESESSLDIGSDDNYVTLYRKDFDAQDPDWYWDLQGDTASGTISDGYAFLNITDETPNNASGRVVGCTKGKDPVTGYGQWQYVSMEVRLRCSDDNQLGSEKGGGLRAWGLANYIEFPRNCILFVSWSPGSIPENVGFWGLTKIGDFDVIKNSLMDIDMTEWHTYTAIWEPDNATLMVDGRIVGTANRSPIEPMFGDVFLQNLYQGETYSGYMDVVGDVSIQVDYVRLFTSKERFEGWAHEVSRAEELLNEAESRGINTTDLSKYFEEVKDIWHEGYYNYYLAAPYLKMINPYIEHFDEISEMFTNCEELIEKSKQEGAADRTIRMMEGYYADAERYWGEYNYEFTELNLQKIIALGEQSP